MQVHHKKTENVLLLCTRRKTVDDDAVVVSRGSGFVCRDVHARTSCDNPANSGGSDHTPLGREVNG